MDWGLIGVILAVVFGIVAIISIIIAVRLVKRKTPIWAYRTRHIIGRAAEAPAELRLMFGSREVSDVYNTTIVFLNKGNDIIDQSDVPEKITFHFRNAEILKEPVVKANRNVTGFSARQEENAIQLDFKWLGHHDGATIEVWHSRSELISCSGEVKNVKVTQVEKTDITRRGVTLRDGIVTSIICLAFIVFIWIGTVKAFFTPVIDWEMVVWSIIMTAFAGSSMGLGIYRSVRYITYPSWARFGE